MNQTAEQEWLPPGQRETKEFHRFGLTWLAARYPYETKRIAVELAGDVAAALELGALWDSLPRVEQISNFHCVTSWSVRDLRWSGVRFNEFYEKVVADKVRPEPDATLVVFIGQDGYRNALPLEDLLAADVLLADRLDGEPLSVEHGAPLRLVAPAHYGYKNVKHLSRIEFRREAKRHHRIPGPIFMSHPRGRVALQERGRGLPGWVYRLLYRPLIGITVWAFRQGTAYHRRNEKAEKRR